RAHIYILLNNLCKVFNGKVVGGWEKPVITLLEYKKKYCMKRIVNVKAIIDKCDGPLTPTATIILDSIKKEATYMIVRLNSKIKHQVSGSFGEQCHNKLTCKGQGKPSNKGDGTSRGGFGNQGQASGSQAGVSQADIVGSQTFINQANRIKTQTSMAGSGKRVNSVKGVSRHSEVVKCSKVVKRSEVVKRREVMKECPKLSRNYNQRAFVGGSWSDSDEDEEERTKDKNVSWLKHLMRSDKEFVLVRVDQERIVKRVPTSSLRVLLLQSRAMKLHKLFQLAYDVHMCRMIPQLVIILEGDMCTSGFYSQVTLQRDASGVILISFMIQNEFITLSLQQFGQILINPFDGQSIFTNEWDLGSLAYSQETEGPYHTDVPTPEEIHQFLQFQRVDPNRTIKNKNVSLSPNQVLTKEPRHDLKRWNKLIYENVFILGGHWDHLPACLAHILYCILAEQQYNLAYFFVKRIENNGTYDVVERFMRPLALRQARRPRSDRGKSRHSVSSTSTHHNRGSSSHQGDDDKDDGASRASTPSLTTYLNSLGPLDYQPYDIPISSEQNDDLLFKRQTDLLNQTQQIHKELRGGFKSFGKALRGVFSKKKNAPNAPSKTSSTKGTSSSFIDYTPKSPTSFTSPSTNGYLNSPTSPPLKVPPPPLTQENTSMDITLTLSPIILLDVQFNTPSPSPPTFGHLIP
nr:hypothetical protein [Tanacetum cinerariifolium]